LTSTLLLSTFHSVKAVQVVLDDALLAEANEHSRRLDLNRSALVRRALEEFFARQRRLALEEQHRRGYAAKPVKPGEFDVWDEVQAWPET
jgi:metal-responsive CopG/Arc/MetJ family transcriptional regulator